MRALRIQSPVFPKTRQPFPPLLGGEGRGEDGRSNQHCHSCFPNQNFFLSCSAWNDCPDFAIFIPNRSRTRMSGAPTRANLFLTNGATIARRYGFREYDGPPLEPLELFTTKSGEEIVGQLYNFTDKGERAVSLRPEMTPTLARMVAAHERNYKKPIKWFAIPQLFRYERQQKGRLREHFQFNADIIGETDPAADAELIALLIDTLARVWPDRAGFCHPPEQPQCVAGIFSSNGGGRHDAQRIRFFPDH